MNEISIYKDLNVVRMFIYMETESFSNKYHQILFTPEQYKKLSLYMYQEIMNNHDTSKCGHPGCDGKSFEVGDEIITLPDKPDKI